jgi:hypothetical protein
VITGLRPRCLPLSCLAIIAGLFLSTSEGVSAQTATAANPNNPREFL